MGSGFLSQAVREEQLRCVQLDESEVVHGDWKVAAG